MKKTNKKSTKVVNIFAKKALTVVCKKCKAKAGKPCVHTILHKGKPRTNPHRVRIAAVAKLAPQKKLVLKAKARKVTVIKKRKAA